MSFVLPNRKAFSDSITRIFMKYRQRDVDELSDEPVQLLPYQKLVRDYLLVETPYRGLLLYHGLGSGKTRSSIAVAESLMSNKKVYIITPAKLRGNFKGEIRKFGEPIYTFEQHWEEHKIQSLDDRELAKTLGISEDYLDGHASFFMTVKDAAPNFKTLSPDIKKRIEAQIEDTINTRFTFINSDGLSKLNIDRILPSERMFDDSVVIIEEAHNLIGSVFNERETKMKLYDYLYRAKNMKIVCLSGTPTINRPQEIAFLMNLLRGPIERVSVPTKSAITWDEAMMTAFFRQLKDVDTIEYNSVRRTFMLTRNPPNFESVYSEKGERIAVKYNKDFKQIPDIKTWASSWKTEFETKFPGIELDDELKMVVENLECLPTDFEEFMKTFVDGLKIKNALMMGRRIQGLVSYYRGADERMLPKRLDEDKTLTKIPMSDEQFLRYLTVRKEEMDLEARKKRMPSLNDDMGSFRMGSRLACNYAVPPEFKYKISEETGETETSMYGKPISEDKLLILAKLDADPERFLKPKSLAIYSPKMAAILKGIKDSVGEAPNFRNQFVYSEFKTLEGLGVFALVLKHNGFQRYKLIKEGGLCKEDPSMEKGKPAFALYTGDETDVELDLIRDIFNGKETYSETFPASLRDSIKEKRLCILMGNKPAAEGITLINVRNVYIMEPYWNPSRIDQVIGRAIRLNSHKNLPPEERTVTVKLYMSVFGPEQISSSENNVVLVRKNDTDFKFYEGDEPKEGFISSDEMLYEVSYRKNRIIKSLALVMKQAAVDCEIHRKLHSKEQPVIQCMRFDTSITAEDLAYRPKYLSDERDEMYALNLIKRKRKLQIIKVKGLAMVLDPQSNEIFDYGAWGDEKRLLQIGRRTGPTSISFFPHVVV